MLPGTKFTEDLNIDSFEDETSGLRKVHALWVDNRDGDGDKDIYFSSAEIGVGIDEYAVELAK